MKRRNPVSTMRIRSAVAVVALSAAGASAQDVTLPPGTALRIALNHRVRIRLGAPVTGHLTEPVFIIDHEVLPVGTMVSGTIRGTVPDTRKEHIRRLLAADFTPPRIPEVVFDTLVVPARGGSPERSVSILAPAEETTASILRFGSQQKKRSLREQAKDAIQQGKQQVKDAIRQGKDEARTTLHRRDYKEIVEKWAVGQLPYHPLIIWSDARFNADLSDAALLPDIPHPTVPTEGLGSKLPHGVLHARLLSSLTSATMKRGDPVDAIIAQPLFSEDRSRLLVPEGAHLFGKVVQAKPARYFGRNGSLRFSFSKLELPKSQAPAPDVEVHAQVSAIQTAPGEHVALDEEGEAKASGGPAKYVEPALLAVLATAATPDDHDLANGGGAGVGASTTASNGFGLIARVASLATRNTRVVQGFAYYALAKSLYYRGSIRATRPPSHTIPRSSSRSLSGRLALHALTAAGVQRARLEARYRLL